MNTTFSPLTYADFTVELIESLCYENGKFAVCDGDSSGIVWGDQ